MLENGNSIVEALNNACDKIGARDDACSIAEGIENYSNGCDERYVIKPEVFVVWNRTYREVTGPGQLPYNETFTIKYKGVELHDGVDDHDTTVRGLIEEIYERISKGDVIVASVIFGRDPMSCPSNAATTTSIMYKYNVVLGLYNETWSHGWTKRAEGRFIIPRYYKDDPNTHIPSRTDSGPTICSLILSYGAGSGIGNICGSGFRFLPIIPESTT